MKKLSFKEFHDIESSLDFAKITKVKNFSWGDLYGSMGDIPENKQEDYDCYLRWYETYNSPLAKALRE